MPDSPLIIRDGQCVCPAEIETALLDHPAVSEVVVVGVPDRMWGQTVAAAVRLSGPTPQAALELTEYCRGILAPFKVPSRWLFVSRLPRTATGEPCRTTLIEQLAVSCGPDRSSWAAQTPSGLAGPPALDPFDTIGRFRPIDLRVPPQRRSCGLDDLDCL
jgi:acyl-CoA synthetase (AMP-forming)/AMP-acid ligase II